MTAGRCLGNITSGRYHNLLFAACKAHNSLLFLSCFFFFFFFFGGGGGGVRTAGCK